MRFQWFRQSLAFSPPLPSWLSTNLPHWFLFRGDLPPLTPQPTKWQTLSKVASLSDPFGFAIPILIRSKIFIQSPGYYGTNICHFSQWNGQSQSTADSAMIRHVSWIVLRSFTRVSRSGTVTFILQRTILPKSGVTTPELELKAALLLVTMLNNVHLAVSLTNAPCTYRTDSRIVLY